MRKQEAQPKWATGLERQAEEGVRMALSTWKMLHSLLTGECKPRARREAASPRRRDGQGWPARAAIGTLRRDWPERKMVVTLENSLAVSHKGMT